MLGYIYSPSRSVGLLRRAGRRACLLLARSSGKNLLEETDGSFEGFAAQERRGRFRLYLTEIPNCFVVILSEVIELVTDSGWPDGEPNHQSVLFDETSLEKVLPRDEILPTKGHPRLKVVLE